MALKEALQKEKELTKEMTQDMTMKQKLLYFWDYYKWHFMVAVGAVALIIYLVVHYINLKEELLFATMVNFSAIETKEEEFKKAFIEFAGIDADNYTVQIDDDVSIGLGMSLGTAYGGQDVMAAYIGAEQLDVLCTCDNVFFDYAYENNIMALSYYMSDEEIEKYSDRLYYVDGVVVDGYTNAIKNMDYDYSAEAPSPDKPEDMENPIAVGIFVDDSPWLNDCYKCQDEEAEHFVVGVIGNSHRAELAKVFIEFLVSGCEQ